MAKAKESKAKKPKAAKQKVSEPTAPKPMGRPSSYTIAIGMKINQRLADGESLRTICLGEDMPAQSTVFRWLTLDKDFSEQYARAREAQAEHLIDEIIAIADDGTNDWMDRQNADGTTGDRVVDHEHVSRSKLRIDARKWFITKVAPKKYGDKLATTLSGPDGGPVETTTEIKRTIVDPPKRA